MSALLLPGNSRGALAKSVNSFWIFGLLRPKLLRVLSYCNSRLHCSGSSVVRIIEGGDSLSVDIASAPLSISGFNGEAVACLLEIPGVIRRHYFGTVEIRARGDILIPVVFMRRDVAVASIVSAELPVSNAPFAAMAAQAVVARSFIAAARIPRHHEADFCDTTHCQFLRSPAANASLVAKAIRQTRDLTLVCAGELVPALYSAACGGHTDSA